MVCYAIKNELGQYLGITTDCNYYYWTDIEYCYFFREKDIANFKKLCYPDCKVVKVEIKEIEDGKIDL